MHFFARVMVGAGALLFSQTAAAVEMFACMDTDRIGFDSSDNMAPAKFGLQKFILKVDFENNRILNEDLGFTERYSNCSDWKNNIFCENGLGAAIRFDKREYNFSFAYIPKKSSNEDPSLSYGPCEKY